jgi:hypothetical protein
MSEETNVPQGAVIDAPTPHTPELGTQIQPPEKAPEPKAEVKPDKPAKAEVERSSGEAVKRAMEALKAKEAEKAKTEVAPKPVEKVEAKAEPKPADRSRAEDGKFAPKESADPKSVEQRAVQEKTEGNQTSEGRKPHHEAPARFNEFGKRDWANTPDTVKEETYRAFKELEEGHKKYKDSADRYEKVREFDDLARQNGREGVHESLKQIVDIENAFQRDPIDGLKRVTDHFGINLQAVASHIVGQNPNQQVAEAHAKIQELEVKIQHMEFERKAPDLVAEFAAQEGHERFEELTPVIATLLKTGTAKDLEAAYELADVLSPAASNAAKTSQPLIPAESAPAQTQAPALNPAGSKSVSGAPSGGISPASKQPVSKSNNEAVKRAMAKLGA